MLRLEVRVEKLVIVGLRSADGRGGLGATILNLEDGSRDKKRDTEVESVGCDG